MVSRTAQKRTYTKETDKYKQKVRTHRGIILELLIASPKDSTCKLA